MEFQCRYFYWFCGYTCQVIKIAKTSLPSMAILITGEHLEGNENDDVKQFSIESQPLDAFPRNLHEKFPNLTHLEIDGCGLKKISKTDLVGFEDLERLYLFGNDLTSLPDDLFVDMRRLKYISFGSNKLERLSSKLLGPIKNLLEEAWFMENTKINDYFDINDPSKNNLGRLMRIMDSLEPPLPETESQPEPMRNTDRRYEHHQQMVARFEEFKASGEFTGFTIEFRGKEFKVHKNILAAQSLVFRQTFASDDGITEKTFTKEKNFSEASFASFMDFFYTGKVDDEANTLEVFELAAVFEVVILKAICVDKISAALSEENALEVFNLAHHHNCDLLKAKAFKVIQKMLPDLADKMLNNLDHVNKLVTATRESENLLKATKKL